MPELRIDPIGGARVIVAGKRARRPGAVPSCSPPATIDAATDPFAEGNEKRTPPELFAVRDGDGSPDSPGWRVRVVPNMYPALTTAANGESPPPAGSTTPMPPTPPARGPTSEAELFRTTPALGAHEVIVNGPQPVSSLAELPVEQVQLAMRTWRQRMRLHAAGSLYVQLIVNEREQAGASLPHTHAQLYALPFVPSEVARERERFNAHATRTMGQNLLGDLLQEEVRIGDRVVAIDEEAVLIAPFASRLPYQLMLIPRRPAARFEREEDSPLGAALLHDGLCRLARHLGSSPPLNMWVRTAPQGAEHFCWRIDVMPRLTHLAGLELATGLGLNTVPPELAAAQLREA